MPLRSASPSLRLGSSLLLIAQLLSSALPPSAAADLPRNLTGRWTPTQQQAGIQIHMMLLPGYGSAYHSKVLWFYGSGHHQDFYGDLLGWSTGDYDCSAYPAGNLVDIDFAFPPDSAEVFCSGHTLLGDGNLLMAGGTQSGTENGMRHAFIYRPETNRWTRLDSMRAYRWYPTATTMSDGKVLVTSGTSYLHINQMYGLRNAESNPRDSRIFRAGLQYKGLWDSPVSTFSSQGVDFTAPPKPRDGAAGVYHFGATATALFGGKDSSELFQDAYLLRRQDNPNSADFDYNWQKLAPLDGPPAARYEHTLIASRSSTAMVVFGGIIDSLGTEVANAEVWRLRKDLDPLQRWRWKQVEIIGSGSIPGRRAGHTAFFDEPRNRMLIFGGRSSPDSAPADTNVWSLTFSMTQDSATWSMPTVSGTKPAARFDHAWAYDGQNAGDDIFMFGGERGGDTLLSDLWKLTIHPTTGALAWESVTDMGDHTPSPRSQHAMTFEPGSHRISVFGGKLAGGALDSTLHIGVPHPHDGGPPKGWTDYARGPVALRNQVATLELIALFQRVPEIHGPDSTTTWDSLTSAPKLQEWYPQMFSIGPDSVFAAGPDLKSYILNTATQDWSDFPAPSGTTFKGGAAVMYRPWKVMKAGSRDTEQGSAHGATASIDLKAPSTTWKSSINSMVGRVNHNMVMLPNGQVLVVGGTGIIGNPAGLDSIVQPQIWDPSVVRNDSVGRWGGKDTLALDNIRRDYHSTAVLLPDGRVLCGGGNANLITSTRLNVFCPPYLFSGDTLATRPVITSTPERMQYGERFTICMPNNSSSASIALLRPGATTHGFDMNQRYVPLQKVTSEAMGSRVIVDAPENSSIAPPGDYLLFVLNSVGVPSVGRWVRIGPSWDRPDGGAPATVSSVSVVQIASTSVGLNFTAPGDDGASGHASAYKVRVSLNDITTGNFDTDSALAVTVSPPGCAGVAQILTVPGLQPCTPYYFAFKTRDERGNWSAMSAVVSATTIWTGQYMCPDARAGQAREEAAGGGGGARGGTSAREWLTTAAAADTDEAAPTADRLVAEFARVGDGVRWTLHREPWASLTGLAPEDSTGLVFQEWDTAAGWQASGRAALPEGRVGLPDQVGRTRLVFPASCVLEQVALAPSGRTLSDARHSRLGSLEELSDSAPITIESGESLQLTYGASSSEVARAESYFIVRNSARPQSGVSSDRSTPTTTAAPLQFALQQNQPNPFAGTTTIGFVLPTAEKVRLDLFDLVGRRIHTLADAVFAPGEHTLVWDGRTNGGRARPGVYWYRIAAGPHQAQRRMILLP